MSKIFVVKENKDGLIELTKEELENMLDKAYQEGLCRSFYWQYTTTPTITTTFASDDTNPYKITYIPTNTEYTKSSI